jgi:hypothetical protein
MDMDSKEINWEYKYKKLKNTVTACLIVVLFVYVYNNWADFKAGYERANKEFDETYPNK